MAEFVRTRDRRMFERIFQSYRRAMVAYAGRYVRDPQRAEELAQEVFVRVYTTKRYEPEASFKTWIYRVATNVCLNELRKPETRRTVRGIDDKIAAEPAPSSARPDVALEGKRLGAHLDATLKRLPEKQRAAFLLVRMEGMTHDEVAKTLETSVQSVKSLVHRALETLRREAAIMTEGDAK
ncbi:MAG: sigma-70 family RNA polymerase sigma factor [Deltaproteobacteria bacterium]|nr:sigma-70 family RNA polymerase sigma factor [Deltaproteobacteria bacterium]